MPDSSRLQDILETARHLSDSGDDRKALAILENAQKKYPEQPAARWIMFRKAFVLLNLEGLDAARDLVMDALDPDNPIGDSFKAMLRGRVLAAMSEANDVEGLAGLLPDQLLCDASRVLHRQAVHIQRRHGVAPASEPITLGETPSSQSVLSERRISYRSPAKTRYPTSIKMNLDGKKSYEPAVKTYTLTNCTRIFWNFYSFFFDEDGGFIRKF